MKYEAFRIPLSLATHLQGKFMHWTMRATLSLLEYMGNPVVGLLLLAYERIKRRKVPPTGPRSSKSQQAPQGVIVT
jgi:hypothetical protein